MKRSEKRLLFALLGLVLLGTLVVGSDFYLDRRDELRAERTTLENEWIAIRTLFEEKEMWEMRANWLERNQPAFTTNEEIAQAIHEVSQAKDETGFTTSKLNLLPNERTPEYVQAGVSLTAQGDLSAIFRWIYDLTRPESFRVVRTLKLAPDREDSESVVAQMELLRWYAPPES